MAELAPTEDGAIITQSMQRLWKEVNSKLIQSRKIQDLQQKIQKFVGLKKDNTNSQEKQESEPVLR